MKIISFGATDTGKVRGNNEDALLVNDELNLYAVADGVGGNAGGEVASRIAVETLASETPETGPDNVPDAFKPAITKANAAIRRRQEQDPGLAGMGTTLTALLVRDGRAFIANVGDSRAYLLRDGAFRQLTRDHSMVAEHIAAGLITPERARTSPFRHVITRALGIEEEVAADIIDDGLKQDDRFLLCTDGLTGMVTDAEIGDIVARFSPQEAVQELVAAANRAGGEDNITVIVVWVEEV